jgi:hypothetical protein
MHTLSTIPRLPTTADRKLGTYYRASTMTIPLTPISRHRRGAPANIRTASVLWRRVRVGDKFLVNNQLWRAARGDWDLTNWGTASIWQACAPSRCTGDRRWG